MLLCTTTDRGTVQKVIVLPRDDLQTEELVLEEVEVFRVSYFIYTLCSRVTEKIIIALIFHHIFIVGSNSNNHNEDFSKTSKYEFS